MARTLGSQLILGVQMFPLPFVILWKVLTTSFASYNKDKTVRRIVGDSILRYVSALTGTPVSREKKTLEVYQEWAKKANIATTIDDLGEDAHLLWIGPKNLQHVLLIFHGGGYIMPVPDFALSFWKYSQEKVKKKGAEVGFALLHYSLAPEAPFPTQLKQARRALEFLAAAGIEPSCIHIAGDSAGANLALQVLSHALHPHPDVPELHLASPFGGMYLFSPWVVWQKGSPAWKENEGIDYVPINLIPDDAAETLKWIGLPDTYRAFAEPAKAPNSWFHGADKFIDRILVAAGGAECMRDDIVLLADVLREHHRNVELVVQHGGLHVDMVLDFFARESKVGSLTTLFIERLVAECRAE
ncbi:Alpha/Beta hydrolase protein [Mycena capillaripes]|nr:Alpha/Beta hydrolase protein [Mycena capillaripes]